ncbi:MAG: dynamin family protein, partial [Lentisphaeria bacterium]|nr:dynamin family protein [Lentisphaeria bacterium]
MHLLDALEQRFTVAIVGQMRVGKSTLLNALIGKRLAPTGVTETTATINWFRHGTDALCDCFRVHWLNGDTETFPLSEVSKWIGDEENARQTRSLDFFADTDFLRIANVVDTPGTRSVLEAHEEAVQGFLDGKLENDTLAHGGRADAVVYALNPVGRASDKDLLQLFGDRTRLPGASAYNSIAVVQKWEHLKPDPIAAVREKCRRLREQLSGKVSEVIPTSGLLAQLAQSVPTKIWHTVQRLAVDSEETALRKIMRADSLFCRESDGIALSTTERECIKQHIPWVVLPLCVMLAQQQELSGGDELRKSVLELSGLARLRSLLQERFFARAKLIKASTVLAKAWEPCQTALLRM